MTVRQFKLAVIGLVSGLPGLVDCSNGSTDAKTSQEDSTAQTVNHNDFLFTTASLNNSLPEFKDKTDSCASFHEDDWRQIEFISKDQKNAIDKEIAKIKDVFDNHTHKWDTYTAFKKVAVRDLIPQPLTISFSKLILYLTDKPIKIQGLSLENNNGQVKGGFYFSVNGINYYGLVDDDILKTFCIYSADSKESLKSSIDNLSKLLATERLYLVDWRAMHVFDETNIKSDLVKEDRQ